MVAKEKQEPGAYRTRRNALNLFQVCDSLNFISIFMDLMGLTCIAGEFLLLQRLLSQFPHVKCSWWGIFSYTLSEARSGVNWADLMAAQGAFGTDFYDKSKRTIVDTMLWTEYMS